MKLTQSALLWETEYKNIYGEPANTAVNKDIDTDNKGDTWMERLKQEHQKRRQLRLPVPPTVTRMRMPAPQFFFPPPSPPIRPSYPYPTTTSAAYPSRMAPPLYPTSRPALPPGWGGYPQQQPPDINEIGRMKKKRKANRCFVQ